MTTDDLPPPTLSIPDLLLVLDDWVADNRDKFDRAYLTADPGEIGLVIVAHDLPYDHHVGRETTELVHDLHAAIHRAGRCRAFDFLPTPSRYKATDMPGAIALDDPDAASKLAEGIRTADDLRAELARVAGERGETFEPNPDCYLCQIDLEATAALTGYEAAMDESFMGKEFTPIGNPTGFLDMGPDIGDQ